jgi:preprotein translocase subunit SecD
MNQRYLKIFLILLLIAVVVWIDLPSNPGIKIGDFARTLDTSLGLDLRGGMQVLLEADLPADTPITAEDLDTAKQIIENRTNGLGVSEVVFQVAGDRRILGEFPGITNTDEVIATLKETGQLEFVDFGDTTLPPGTVIKTDYGLSPDALTTSDETTDGAEDPTTKVWHTILTGDQIDNVNVELRNGVYEVVFSLKADGAKIFADHTSKNVNKILAIVLDKQVVSTPSINTPITEGNGSISGSFTYD